jgi:hypothetical protein
MRAHSSPWPHCLGSLAGPWRQGAARVWQRVVTMPERVQRMWHGAELDGYTESWKEMTGRGSSRERSSAWWRCSALRQTSHSKRKKSPELGSRVAQERHEHEEHGGGAHRRLEAKGNGSHRQRVVGGRAMHRGG